MKNLYLDQNVLGLIAEHQLTLRPKEEVRWIFSNEHFAEIARGDTTDILDVLRTMNAQRLVLRSDEKGRITDHWIIEKYTDPNELYSEYCHNSQIVDPEIFQGLIAKMFGSQDPSVASSYPEDIAQQFRSHLREVPWLDNLIGSGFEQLVRKAGDETVQRLSDTKPLEERRKPLGFNRGRASNYSMSANPLQDLWEHANKNYPATISADQFFGFDSPNKQLFGYEKWPIFLGISTCYTTLNAIGFRPDEGLARKTRVAANMSDAHHVAYAAFCDGLLSADTRMCEKAFAIYKYREIETGVVDVSSQQVGG